MWITLSSGLVYRAGKDQTQILQDLLKIRRQIRGKGSVAEAAIDGVLTHPVIEAFIRQKWHSARFFYFFHIRLWFLFTVAFSCYLRVEINGQLIRNDFNRTHMQWNASDTPNLDFNAVLRESENVPKCITMMNRSSEDFNKSKALTREEVTVYLKLRDTKICHPNVGAWLPTDSSKTVLLSLLLLSATAWIVFLIKTFQDQLPIRTCTSRPLLPVCQRNTSNTKEKKTFRDCVNLFTTTTVFLIMLICFLRDNRNLKFKSPTPFFDFDDGFLFMEIILLVLALYFVVNFCNEIGAHSSQLIDPSSLFQLVSSLAAIVTLIRKNYLTAGDNAGYGPATAAAAIGITLAYLCLILKYGRYNFTAIGNFATMFHIILKKLGSYMVVAFVLLFGFSFGFWVIEQHDCKDENSHFEGFLTSIKSCFVMFFGGFDNYENILVLDEEIKKGHHLTVAAFYVLFLMMIVVTSLGMLNLLLAAIISDYKKNMKEVHMQNLISMAKYVVLLEQCTGLRNLVVNHMGIARVMNWARLDENVESYTFCTLDLCFRQSDNKDHIHPEEEFRNIINSRRK